MHPFASIGLAVVLAAGPNGAAVTHALKRPGLRRSLPVETLARDAPRLFVVYHGLPDAPMAFYLLRNASWRRPERGRRTPVSTSSGRWGESSACCRPSRSRGSSSTPPTTVGKGALRRSAR